MAFRVPEQHRVTRPFRGSLDYASEPGDPFGVFAVPIGHRAMKVIACDGAESPDTPPEAWGWEHVSVSVGVRGGPTGSVLPTWREMCAIRGLFWEPGDCVVQFHPPESEYVNNAEVLHLWRYTCAPFPLPAGILVGDPSRGRL